ncbi:3-isopropylmalate dehydratase [Balneolaceae bacterium ANBcel3]|nr:3-isopropylmalate dehydratase [Balneolaceae bacterium ANBcel3]
MSKKITGKVFVVGNDIDTDQIIPAEHLVYSLDDPEERRYYGRYALSGVPEAQSGLPKGNIPFTPQDQFESEFKVIIGGKNFGCGSSREHAPFALQVAGAEAVIATGYARIFYRNAVDGGFIIPFESEEDLVKEFTTGDEVEIDRDNSVLNNLTSGKSYPLKKLGDVVKIVEAGGIFKYAEKNGMI